MQNRQINKKLLSDTFPGVPEHVIEEVLSELKARDIQIHRPVIKPSVVPHTDADFKPLSLTDVIIDILGKEDYFGYELRQSRNVLYTIMDLQAKSTGSVG